MRFGLFTKKLFVFSLLGVLCTLVVILLIYYKSQEGNRGKSNFGQRYGVHIFDSDSGKLISSKDNIYYKKIFKIFLDNPAISEKDIYAVLRKYDFIKFIKIKRGWIGKDLIKIKVIEPLAHAFWGENIPENLFSVSSDGLIMDYQVLSLPFIRIPSKIKVEENRIKNRRILSWLKFLQKAGSNKTGNVINYISELYFSKNYTGLWCMGLKTKIELPVYPNSKLLVKLDSAIKFLVLKSIVPRELNLMGENAIFKY